MGYQLDKGARALERVRVTAVHDVCPTTSVMQCGYVRLQRTFYRQVPITRIGHREGTSKRGSVLIIDEYRSNKKLDLDDENRVA